MVQGRGPDFSVVYAGLGVVHTLESTGSYRVVTLGNVMGNGRIDSESLVKSGVKEAQRLLSSVQKVVIDQREERSGSRSTCGCSVVKLDLFKMA